MTTFVVLLLWQPLILEYTLSRYPLFNTSLCYQQNSMNEPVSFTSTLPFSLIHTVSVIISDTMLTPLEGEELNISCIIRGIPPLPNITWYKDGVLFPPPALPRVFQINPTVVKWQLTFASVNRSDTGNYTCSATQSRGGEVTVVNSSAVYLNVFCKYHIFSVHLLSSCCM